MRALFVDDEVEFLELMHKRLTRRGMEVVTAPDGQTALHLLDQAMQEGQTFEIVVMDVRMPGMDGLEALKAIRSKDSSANVVMCSAMGQEGMVMDAVRSGAKDFIVKPFKPDRVLKTVNNILGTP